MHIICLRHWTFGRIYCFQCCWNPRHLVLLQFSQPTGRQNFENVRTKLTNPSLQPLDRPSPSFVVNLAISLSTVFTQFLILLLSRSQFQEAMLFRDSALLDRIFKVFDTDNNDLIDFNEYVACLSTVSNKASSEDKLARKRFPFLYFLCVELTLWIPSFEYYQS